MIYTLQLDNHQYQSRPANSRPGTRGVCRTEWHRPRNRQPFALVSGYGETQPAVSEAPHPLARRRFAGGLSLVLTGAISAAVVAGLIAIAHLRATEPVPAPTPVTTVAQMPDVPAP